MPKKLRFESAVHQLMVAADRFRERLAAHSPADSDRFAEWVRHLGVAYKDSMLRVSWSSPQPGCLAVPLSAVKFYVRGDRRDSSAGDSRSDVATEPRSTADPVEAANAAFFDEQLRRIIAEARVVEAGTSASACMTDAAASGPSRQSAEADFHDHWAAEVDVESIDVRAMNEACTAPEMRCIRAALGDLRGLRLLDVGCGLGEASVYFALEGADVTASDISPGMLDATRRLAAAHGVTVETELSASEDLLPRSTEPFDVIYTGNTLHHVDIAQTLDRLLPLLKPCGVFVSWDPLAYNPVINVYRAIATDVRTVDEHPLRLADLRLMRSRFRTSATRYFWLTTLVIFVIMAVVQRRNPNKERFWKKVVAEADAWSWLYSPLEVIDRLLLTTLPFLRPLCWNVVFIGRCPTSGLTAAAKLNSAPEGTAGGGRDEVGS